MKEVTKSGRTVEEALAAALGELQTTEDRVEVQVVEEAKKGLFGIGSKPAVVRVNLKEDEWAETGPIESESVESKTQVEEAPIQEDSFEENLSQKEEAAAAPLETARTFLKEVTEKMGVPVEIEVKRNARGAVFQLSGEKIAILIGKRGSTLNALQYLTNIAANRHENEHIHVLLDAENYRARRKESLQQMAKRLSDRVRETGREARLDPMPSMERKVIHIALKDEKGIATYSEGADPSRRVIIVPSKNE